MHRITVNLPPGLHQALTAEARNRHRSLSSILTEALLERYGRERLDPDLHELRELAITQVRLSLAVLRSAAAGVGVLAQQLASEEQRTAARTRAVEHRRTILEGLGLDEASLLRLGDG